MYGKTQKDFVNDLQGVMNEALSIVQKKNSDYATEADPFKNFRFSTLVSVDVAKAILIRVCDKMARISNVLDKGEVQVKDETVEDTIKDTINYMAILLTYIRWEAERIAKSEGKDRPIRPTNSTKEMAQ